MDSGTNANGGGITTRTNGKTSQSGTGSVSNNQGITDSESSSSNNSQQDNEIGSDMSANDLEIAISEGA